MVRRDVVSLRGNERETGRQHGSGVRDGRRLLDGIWRKTVDWYSEKPHQRRHVFEAANLPDGKHLLGILTRGDKRAASTGTSINWSRIEYVAGRIPNVLSRFSGRGSIPTCRCGWTIGASRSSATWAASCITKGNTTWWAATGRQEAARLSLRLGQEPGHGRLFVARLDELDLPRALLRRVERSEPSLYNYTHAAGRGKLIPGAAESSSPCSRWSHHHVRQRRDLRDECHGRCRGRPAGGPLSLARLPGDGRQRVQGSDTAVFADDDGKRISSAAQRPGAWNVSDCIYELAADCLAQ